MSKLIDLTNQQFGCWKIIERAPSRKNKTYWRCQCLKCLQFQDVQSISLRKGAQCRCLQVDDLTKQSFGKLTVLDRAWGKTDKTGNAYWRCQCECGNEVIVASRSLKSKDCQSCGCLNASIGELNIIKLLIENNIAYIKEYKVKELGNLRYDFYLPKYNRLIEFDGTQHYEECAGVWDNLDSLEARQSRDEKKNKYAILNNIDLVRIPYWARDNITLDMILGNQYLYKEK